MITAVSIIVVTILVCGLLLYKYLKKDIRRIDKKLDRHMRFSEGKFIKYLSELEKKLKKK